MEEFVEQPHPSLGNWPPCPFARQARLNKSILVKPGTDPYIDGLSLKNYDWSKEVVIFWYDHAQYLSNKFIDDVKKLNKELLPLNIAALDGHPDIEEVINGVDMNFGFCAILVVQKLDKLNQAADQLREKGYYDHWEHPMIDRIVNWRYNKKDD